MYVWITDTDHVLWLHNMTYFSSVTPCTHATFPGVNLTFSLGGRLNLTFQCRAGGEDLIKIKHSSAPPGERRVVRGRRGKLLLNTNVCPRFSAFLSLQLIRPIPASSRPAVSFLTAWWTPGRRRRSVSASWASCQWTACPARACVSSSRTTAKEESAA